MVVGGRKPSRAGASAAMAGCHAKSSSRRKSAGRASSRAHTSVSPSDTRAAVAFALPRGFDIGPAADYRPRLRLDARADRGVSERVEFEHAWSESHRRMSSELASRACSCRSCYIATYPPSESRCSGCRTSTRSPFLPKRAKETDHSPTSLADRLTDLPPTSVVDSEARLRSSLPSLPHALQCRTVERGSSTRRPLLGRVRCKAGRESFYPLSLLPAHHLHHHTLAASTLDAPSQHLASRSSAAGAPPRIHRRSANSPPPPLQPR
jgi:hypothetical protein